MYFTPRNCFFSLFLATAKLKMEFLSNFSPIVLCSNLLSKLFEIGKKLLKNPFSILQFSKKAKKAIFWSKIQFFVNFKSFKIGLVSPTIVHLHSPWPSFFFLYCTEMKVVACSHFVFPGEDLLSIA